MVFLEAMVDWAQLAQWCEKYFRIDAHARKRRDLTRAEPFEEVGGPL